MRLLKVDVALQFLLSPADSICILVQEPGSISPADVTGTVSDTGNHEALS